MEEITTRFEIIRLAIELGDFRTIDLQCEKLQSISLDEKLNEIIDLLESRNYRQALYEMKHYARTLEDDFFAERERKTPSEKDVSRNAPADLGLFDLGTTPEREEDEEERVLGLDEILRLSKKHRTPEAEAYRPAPEFAEPRKPSKRGTIGSEAVEEGRPEGDVATHESPETSEEPLEAKEAGRSVAIPDDGIRRSFHLSVSFEDSAASPSSGAVEGAEKFPADFGAEVREEERERKAQRHGAEGEAVATPMEDAPRKGGGERTATGSESRHPPISYISQKFRNMMHQFPPVEREAPIPESVVRMQKKIATEGYTEEEIEEFLKQFMRYKEKGKRAEAAMVLLLAAATESKFAQFLLARELFRGEILRQDHAEAFTQINTLADQNFAEAICDLGQFYEHGVGIGKDRQMALLLYEEAAEMGVERARRHYERLKNSRGLLGVFKKVSLPKVSIPLPKKK